METENITINKNELYDMIRNIIRNELLSIKEVSNEEQLEINNLHGDSPKEFNEEYVDL